MISKHFYLSDTLLSDINLLKSQSLFAGAICIVEESVLGFLVSLKASKEVTNCSCLLCTLPVPSISKIKLPLRKNFVQL